MQDFPENKTKVKRTVGWVEVGFALVGWAVVGLAVVGMAVGCCDVQE